MKIFVSGATGAQGCQIANKVMQAGHAVATLSSKDNIQETPVEIIKGGFNDLKSLNMALMGVDVAVFTFPLLFDLALAQTYTQNFVIAAKKRGVSLIVFNTSFDLPQKQSSMLAIEIKVRIKDIFDRSGLNVITLMPDVYIDNFAAPWSMPIVLREGLLPYPIASDTKVPFISLSDLGDYVASAVEKPHLAGEILPVGGTLLTGEEIAAAITAYIKTPVQFLSVTPDAFEKQLVPLFGALAAKEVSNLYRHFDKNKKRIQGKNFAKSQALLSVMPQHLNDWVKSVNWSV